MRILILMTTTTTNHPRRPQLLRKQKRSRHRHQHPRLLRRRRRRGVQNEAEHLPLPKQGVDGLVSPTLSANYGLIRQFLVYTLLRCVQHCDISISCTYVLFCNVIAMSFQCSRTATRDVPRGCGLNKSRAHVGTNVSPNFVAIRISSLASTMSAPPSYGSQPVNPDSRPLPEGWIQQYDPKYVSIILSR